MKKLFVLITLLATLNGAQAQEIVAHRGYWKDNAQNSIASLQKAQAFGCWGSEFDLHLTADNCVVVNHDREIKKTDIQKSTLEKIRSFTLKNGEPVPTLEEYLEQSKKDENCVLVRPYDVQKEAPLASPCLAEEQGQYLCLETLTWCFIDTKPLDLSLMSDDELRWLNHYNQQVLDILSPHLNADEVAWLKEKCRPVESNVHH